MAQPGEILFYEKYRFRDGSSADKLFVILNAADSATPCLVLKTTSRAERYAGTREGCNPARKVFYIPDCWKECLDKSTYVQLPEIIPIPVSELLKGSFDKRIRTIGTLTPNCLAQLKNCLKKHFRDDISPRNWKQIF
jgi:hypothetical protein